MKIWSTKYCLTAGITEHDVETVNSGVITIQPTKQSPYLTMLCGEGKEWHRSEEAAITKAEEVKVKKLKSLDKQIKKISAIEFGT